MLNARTWVQVQNVYSFYNLLHQSESVEFQFKLYWTVSEISKHSTWRNEQDHVTLPQPQVPLQLPAKCCGEWGRDRASLTLTAADMKGPVAGSAQAFQGSRTLHPLKRFWQSWCHCLHHLHNPFWGGASLQPSAVRKKHHPKNIPAWEGPSTGKGLEGRAKRMRGCSFAWKLNNTSRARQGEGGRLVSDSTKGVCSDSWLGPRPRCRF